MDRGVETGESDHRCEYHIDRTCLYDLVKRLGTGIDLHVGQVAHQGFQLVVTLLVGNDDGGGLELMSLLGQQLYLIISSQTIDLVQVAMFLDDFKCLCSDRTGGTEYGNLFLHYHSLNS